MPDALRTANSRLGETRKGLAGEPSACRPCRRLRLYVGKECIDLAHDLGSGPLRNAERHMAAVDLDRDVALAFEAISCPRRDDPVPARPDSESRHRRVVGGMRDRRLVDLVRGHPGEEAPDVVLPR